MHVFGLWNKSYANIVRTWKLHVERQLDLDLDTLCVIMYWPMTRSDHPI